MREGLITGFFTYTGPAYGTRHDEIDFEFLGRDTRKVQVAWFRDGALTSHLIPLPFDAAERFATYDIDFLPGELRWHVEGEEVFRIAGNDLPDLPQRLFLNLWAAAPGLEGWSGVPGPATEAVAEVRCVGFTPWEGTDFAADGPCG